MTQMLEVFVEFDGNAKDAFAFYREVFDTDAPQLMRVKDAPAEGTAGMDLEAVMYGSVAIGKTHLMGSDNFTGDYAAPRGMYLSWGSTDADEVDAVWQAFIEAGSTVEMDLGETFWSKKYGILRDPYGIGWMLSLYSPEDAQ